MERQIKKYLKCSDMEDAELAEKQREEHLELNTFMMNVQIG